MCIDALDEFGVARRRNRLLKANEPLDHVVAAHNGDERGLSDGGARSC